VTPDEPLFAALSGLDPQPSRDWLDAMKDEIMGYATELKDLNTMPSDEAMQWISAISARVHEMIMETLRSDGRQATKWRIDGLLTTRDELRFQFEVSSRRVTLMKIEADQLRGEAY
jgi:hypothetical protein